MLQSVMMVTMARTANIVVGRAVAALVTKLWDLAPAWMTGCSHFAKVTYTEFERLSN